MTEHSQLWAEWLVRYQAGYFQNGILLDHFVSRDAVMPLAQAFAANRNDQPLTQHQLRRFFQHSRLIEQNLKLRRRSWEESIADFRKLDIAAADGLSKTKERRLNRLFHDFIRANVAAVTTEKDFRDGFIRHFEAVVGFGSGFYRENSSTPDRNFR